MDRIDGRNRVERLCRARTEAEHDDALEGWKIRAGFVAGNQRSRNRTSISCLLTTKDRSRCALVNFRLTHY